MFFSNALVESTFRSLKILPFIAIFAQQLDSTSSGNPSVAQDTQTSIQNNTNSAAAYIYQFEFIFRQHLISNSSVRTDGDRNSR